MEGIRHQNLAMNTATTANTDFLAADIAPKANIASNPTHWKITLSCRTAAKLKLTKKQAAPAVTRQLGLNDNVAIPADQLYSFVIPVSSSFTYNFQFDTTTILDEFYVDEV